MTNSLQGRLLLVATLVLALFLTLCGVALDRAYRDAIRVGIEQQLQGQVYGLLASADIQSIREMALPEALPEARFGQMESGLYAALIDETEAVRWQSGSAIGIELPALTAEPPGQTQFEMRTNAAGDAFFLLAAGVSWEVDGDDELPVTFVVAEDDSRYRQQIAEFRNTLLIWLGSAGFILLLVQAVILRWGLRPVRRAAQEINEIERGERDTLGADYPRELRALTHNINNFISNEKRILERYRNTLGDLAHSLKTPLAVLAGLGEHSPALREQVDRMTNIVDYQLHRASSSSQSLLHGKVAVSTVLDKILVSLHKVYADKRIDVDAAVPDTLCFHGEQGDLYEMLGNVVDNAFKYGRSRVRISARELPPTSRGVVGLSVIVEDDGPGIAAHLREQVLMRGSRASETSPGHGIGLAVVTDLVRGMGGSLGISDSDLGGAAVSLTLPPTHT